MKDTATNAGLVNVLQLAVWVSFAFAMITLDHEVLGYVAAIVAMCNTCSLTTATRGCGTKKAPSPERTGGSLNPTEKQ